MILLLKQHQELYVAMCDKVTLPGHLMYSYSLVYVCVHVQEMVTL